jgi:DNA-binding NtrC family response regulator
MILVEISRFSCVQRVARQRSMPERSAVGAVRPPVGRSRVMRELFETPENAASTDFTVLIEG